MLVLKQPAVDDAENLTALLLDTLCHRSRSSPRPRSLG